jgi:regulation of enolase protein 1 (concanavalin A-like superfamily)
MPPARCSFDALNVQDDVIPEWLDSFFVTAPPNTDLWRKPPSGDISTAPILYTALSNPFIVAEVTVSADWQFEWDQGGLVIFSGPPPGHIATASTTATATLEVPDVASIRLDDNVTSNSATSFSQTSSIDNVGGRDMAASQRPAGEPASSSQPEREPPPPYDAPAPTCKWVKLGLEFSSNTCHATAVVANGEGADWSLSTLPSRIQRRKDLHIKMERIGYALWMSYEIEPGMWKKLREVTWFFWDVEDKAVRVGVYASRPANFGFTMWDQNHGADSSNPYRNLCVEFEGLEIH